VNLIGVPAERAFTSDIWLDKEHGINVTSPMAHLPYGMLRQRKHDPDLIAGGEGMENGPGQRARGRFLCSRGYGQRW
jgi:hypothetical protein